MKDHIHLIVIKILFFIYFQVGNNDTLEKVALRFNSTPSELLHLNKLNTRMIFPGQVSHIFFI
jgi:LysM repeat protein